MRTFVAVILAIVVCSRGALAAEDQSLLAAQLDKLITELASQGFAGCVLVEQKGKTLLRKGYGLADRTSQTPNAPEMRYDIGSVTKTIISAAILFQVKNGTLKLDSKLSDLLKKVPKDKQAITVEQLLSHTSGFSRSYSFPKNTDMTKRDAVVAAVLKLKLATAPDAQHAYSNANYFLLAAILDSIDERGYEQTIRETIFQPLKMKTAGFTADPLLPGETSPVRYEAGATKGTMVAWYHSWGHRGATGVACSVDDLAAFVKALTAAEPFNEQERAEWLRVRKDSYALGWSVLETPGRPKVIVHGGSSIGSQSILAYYPEFDTTLVVLMNSTTMGNTDEWAILRAVGARLGKK